MNCKNVNQWRSKDSVRLVGHGNPTPSGSFVIPKVDQVRSGARCEPSTNHFSSSQSVERERTGSRISTGSEPAPKMRWWKRGNSSFAAWPLINFPSSKVRSVNHGITLMVKLWKNHWLIWGPSHVMYIQPAERIRMNPKAILPLTP